GLHHRARLRIGYSRRSRTRPWRALRDCLSQNTPPGVPAVRPCARLAHSRIRPAAGTVGWMIADLMSARIAASILVVEDDPQQIRVYTRALPDCRLTCVSNGTAALQALRDSTPDLILLDHVLSGGEKGTEFLPRLKAVAAHVPIIVISGSLDIRQQLKALQG